MHLYFQNTTLHILVRTACVVSNVSADHFGSMQKDPNGDLLLHVRDLLQAVEVVDVSAVHSLPPGPRGEESWVRVVSVPLDVLQQLLGHSGPHYRLESKKNVGF